MKEDVANILRRTLEKLSSYEVTEVITRAGFSTERHRLIGLLKEISLAVETDGRPDMDELKDACYLCDRFVDSIHKFRHRSRVVTQVRALICGPNFSRKLPQVKETANLLKVKNEADIGSNLLMLNDTFDELHRPVPHRPRRSISGRSISAYVEESGIFGRYKDLDNILRAIFSGKSNGLRFVRIIGSDGSGKTTLARLVYNYRLVKKDFDCRMWVAVPEDFDVELIVMEIIKCTIRSANLMLDLGSVDKRNDYLRGVLRGRKFFLVLDDVRSVNYNKWELLRSVLSFGKEGSTIIMTVREGEGKMIAELGVPYLLEPLPVDEGFYLLVKKAFGTEREADLTAFSKIGKKIVEKCRGLPLAVSMIGGMLWCNPENRNDLLDSLNSRSNGDLDLSTVIEFVYSKLPLHLQSCITYLTLFPNDYAFDKHKVVELWNAEGFISRPNQDYGGQFFDKLVSYSFLQAVQYPYDQVRYHVNHHLCSYARSLSTENFVQYPSHLFTPSQTIGGLSLLCGEDTRTLPNDLSQCHNLRTLLLVKNSKMDELKKKILITRINDVLFTSLAKLCVLDLNSCAISELPKSIKSLSCLRYLNLSETDIETIPKSIGNLRELQILNLSSCKNFHTIPESIGALQNMLILNLSHCKQLCTLHPSITKLRNLETLNLEGCCKLDSLPESMYSLRELRHLNILGCSSLTTMPRRMGWLSHLQTLSRFIATAEIGRKIEELGSLGNLTGALQIENLEKVLDTKDAKRAWLYDKTNITSLALHWSWLNFYNDDNEVSVRTAQHDNEVSVRIAQRVLQALRPPPSLKILDIFSYPGREAPEWMKYGSNFESMVEIRLVNLKRLESLPPLGQFPCLKVIEIRGMDAVTHVDDAFSGDDGMFPKLKKLTFSQMPNLQKWVMEDNQNKFPRLRDLTVANCPKLKELQFSCSSLKNLTLLFNNEMLYSSSGALEYVGRSLRKLTIGLCCELVEISTFKAPHHLTALEELEISECDELISLPHCMRYLTSLRYLTITNCRNLETLPDWQRNSTSRPELCISGCPKLHREI